MKRWKKRTTLPLVLLILVGVFGVVFFASEDRVSEESLVESNVPKELGIRIIPESVQQGEPALIAVEGLEGAKVTSLTFNRKKIGVFSSEEGHAALVGIDLKMKPGEYPVVLMLEDGRKIEKVLAVRARPFVQAPLGIPDKLGGNTSQGEANVISALANENAILDAVTTTPEALWKGPFAYPVQNPIVTDEYGYTRLTGASSISHKGTDFRAPTGTPILAMNSGVVRIARKFTVYGNAVVIDHGAGVQTLYLHLSEMNVKKDDWVEKGQEIGKSGSTGYAESPHLHLSVKINGISIDPMKFMELFEG